LRGQVRAAWLSHIGVWPKSFGTLIGDAGFGHEFLKRDESKISPVLEGIFQDLAKPPRLLTELRGIRGCGCAMAVFIVGSLKASSRSVWLW